MSIGNRAMVNMSRTGLMRRHGGQSGGISGTSAVIMEKGPCDPLWLLPGVG